MNSQKIYSDITGREAKEETKKSTQEDLQLKQIKFDWLQSTITAELLKNLRAEETSLIDHAVELAATYHMNNNPIQIINTLVKVKQIRNTVKQITAT